MKVTTLLSATAAATLVSAGTFHLPKTPGAIDLDPHGFIVEYHSEIQHRAAFRAMNSRKVTYQVRNQYSVFNGAAITVNSAHTGDELADIPGIKNVWPITYYRIPRVKNDFEANATDPITVSDHSMTGVDVLQKQYKLSGKGIKVGVVDTGIDYKHPAFALPGAKAGCFGPGCRVATGWDFVGDDYQGTNPKPGPDPMDCEGHGTHVAGIIGANALNITGSPQPPQPFVGVAPEVTFGAYRVFGCEGSAGTDIILAAMERAFKDGMDILNMSLGGGSDYKINPEALLADKLTANGMVVVVAAGNDGSDGVWMVSDASLGDLTTSTASVDNIYGNYYSFTYAGASYPYSPSATWNKPIDLPESATLMPLLNSNGDLSDGCDNSLYKSGKYKGKVVLVLGDFSRCKSAGRGDLAAKAGVKAMLVQTTPYGLASLGGFKDFPMASVEFKTGEAVLAAYKENSNNTVTWSKTQSNFLIEGGGAPSSFSSFGLDGDLRSKPDQAAPGGNILSTYPLAKGGYEVQSGTSMATPYVAGAYALYMQSKGTKPRGDVLRKIFKNTAKPVNNFQAETKASAVKQGAGLINALNAVLTTSSIEPDHIDLLDTVNFVKTTTISITNSGSAAETYTLSHTSADTLIPYNGTSSWPSRTPGIEADYATVVFNPATVKIPAGQSANVTVTFTEPANADASVFPLYSGFLVATPASSNGIAVQVPYTGMKGDVSKVPIMDTDSGFPALVYVNSSGDLSELPKDPNFVFDLRRNMPVVMTRLGSHTPSLEIRIFDGSSASGRFMGFMESVNAGTAIGPSGRDRTINPKTGEMVMKPWAWNGQVKSSATAARATKVPAGRYRLVAATQRKFTPGNYPADYVVYELGTIRVR